MRFVSFVATILASCAVANAGRLEHIQANRGVAPVTSAPAPIGRGVPAPAAPTCPPVVDYDRYTPEAHADQIHHLPGLVGKFASNVFSGYVSLPGTEKEIWYMFVESSGSPSTDPLVLSQAGGPGLPDTRFIFGEHGPFRVSPDADVNHDDKAHVFLNPWSIHSFSNGLYFDAPFGVGFSYSKNATDYAAYNDEIAANDNLAALQQFFLKFPQYQQNDLHILANSYGGHYGPQLAQLIVEQTECINLKGVMVTQPLLNFEINQYPGVYYKLYADGLISQNAMNAVQESCITPYNLDNSFDYLGDTNCNNANNLAFGQFASLNVMQYGVSYATCTPDEQQRYLATYEVLKPILFDHDSSQEERNRAYDLLGFNACLEPQVEQYINTPSVRAALHVETKGLAANPMISNSWVVMENMPVYGAWDFNSILIDMKATYQFLIDSNIRIHISSAANDAECPTVATMLWLQELGAPVINDFQPWVSNNRADQVAGILHTRQGISMNTIQACGHLQGWFCPSPFNSVVQQYLSNTWNTAPSQTPFVFGT